MNESNTRLNPSLASESEPRSPEAELEAAMTSPADVASAGRSCLVILILALVILLLLCVWVAFGATGHSR